MTHIKFSVLGGTLSSAWIHITSDDLIKTALMAAIGAVISYVVSLLVKRLHQTLLKLRSGQVPRKKKK
ncbi:hypothetical protein C7H61_09015 [Mesoflavibacter zeaxanthinifaciens subsp. sabulilitoris]|uniref:Uncharacterized protein n=1 Tax=Mesoflavibacter zeaxanthinifaciens subsp. sabulilitoris TaxID=1520893 RepID=A0A2T1NBA6_9FLAO|nr:hypothetical protein C7H61_09015 [Mesoflavibacter zeaxanthinifaciens subsp. sabulilitoris]